jgi:hypothetical protein
MILLLVSNSAHGNVLCLEEAVFNDLPQGLSMYAVRKTQVCSLG